MPIIIARFRVAKINLGLAIFTGVIFVTFTNSVRRIDVLVQDCAISRFLAGVVSSTDFSIYIFAMFAPTIDLTVAGIVVQFVMTGGAVETRI